MFVRAGIDDKRSIYLSWKEYYSSNDNGSVDYFFDDVFKEENCYLYKKNNEIISAIHIEYQDVVLFNNKVRTAVISGGYTISKYRKKGYFTSLLNYVLDLLSNQCLITLYSGRNCEFYYKHDFLKTHYINEFTVKRNQLGTFPTTSVDSNYRIKELLKVYDLYTSSFTGYNERSLDYYKQYMVSIGNRKGKVAVYRENNQVVGYVVYFEYITYIKIEEIVYSKLKALLTLLSYLLDKNSKVRFSMTVAENIAPYFKELEKNTMNSAVIHINNHNLFERFYQVDSNETANLFRNSKKPYYYSSFK